MKCTHSYNKDLKIWLIRFFTNPWANQETKPETYSRWSKIESVVLWYGFCVVAVQSMHYLCMRTRGLGKKIRRDRCIGRRNFKLSLMPHRSRKVSWPLFSQCGSKWAPWCFLARKYTYNIHSVYSTCVKTVQGGENDTHIYLICMYWCNII